MKGMMEPSNEIVIYQNSEGTIKLDVLLKEETVWLTQKQMSELFQRDRTVITKHIANIFEEGELIEESNVHFLHIANSDKPVKHYNLDVIISVGYRVKSIQGTRFRIWATKRLNEYIVKGFALNDERFKTGSSMNYFRELLDRIREIRLSEKVFYQQIKDIYAISIDYDPSNEMTLAFFKEVQNKLLWAVSGKTAAELIFFRANASLPQMGLTSTKTPMKVNKAKIDVGKNYLKEDELTSLKLIVEQYLAYAEAQAFAHKPMYMKDWIEKLSQVLTMNEKNILDHAGSISHNLALKKAENEYDKFIELQKKTEHLECIRQLDTDLKALKKIKNERT